MPRLNTPILLTCTWLLLAGLARGTAADDTDIYLNPTVPSGSEPLIMFVLDWRSNLGATVSCPVNSYCDGLRTAGYLRDGQPGGSGASTTFFNMLRAVLMRVLDPIGGIRIGFMMNHSDKQGCEGYPPRAGCSNGAYIPMGFRSMAQGDDSESTWLNDTGEDPDKILFRDLLDAIPVPQGNLAHPYQGKELYFELFRYLTGQPVYNGQNGFIDFGDLQGPNVNLDVELPVLSWDPSILTSTASGPRYVSPLGASSSCAKIYVINLMFQVSQQEDNSDIAIRASKASGGMQGINLTGNSNTFPTVIGYLHDADLADGTFGEAPALAGKQNVVSYFIVDPTKINTTTGAYAAAGGTGQPLPLSEDPQVLVELLDNILRSILSVSTTFAAPSIPVNVFNRSQVVNDVYLGLFEADGDGKPFWPGNLKKLKLGLNATTRVPELQDTSGLNAIDIDGRIKPSALTLWTNPATLPAPSEGQVAGADGPVIKRGGAGQRIPGYDPNLQGSPGLANATVGARKLYTEDAVTSDGPLVLVNLDAPSTTSNTAQRNEVWNNLTRKWTPAPSSSTYSSATTTEKERAVRDLRYVRGYTAPLITDTTTTRDWFLGDPIHSRPVPVNYGARGTYSRSNPDIRILMATTDGIMHMFRNTNPDGSQSGGEVWGYMPQRAMEGQQRLREALITDRPLHPILLDGTAALYQKDLNADGTLDHNVGDKVWAFFGMRRGGRGYYALDVSNPDAPTFLWRLSNETSGFARLAQSWSTPSVGILNYGDGGGRKPVLVFGGGYNGDDDGNDRCEGDAATILAKLGKDAANRCAANDPNRYGQNDTRGNALYVVDATTGELVWRALPGVEGYDAGAKAYRHPDLTDSVPADVTAADMDGNGTIDRVYFGDTGGKVWRADLFGNNPANWKLSLLLNAGRHFNSAANNDLRFFNRPDVVKSEDINGAFDAVLIGTGDREAPLERSTQNRFFMIKDRFIRSGAPGTTTLTPNNLQNMTSLACLTAADSCRQNPDSNLNRNGWYINLEGSGNPLYAGGEKNLAPAITASGTVFFTTFVPTERTGNQAGACALSEGSGFVYAVNLQDSSPVYNYNLANDAPDAPTLERSDVLGGGGIPVEVVAVGERFVLVQGQEVGQNIQRVGGRDRWRTYWYEVEE